ncbi:MAG TPA: PD-(D/E)XK nuclease family protein, partial [Ktedonobacterales bacterium]
MPIFRLHELEQYLACPRQYKYARSYGLLDPAEDAVYRFHRYIRKGMQELRDVKTALPASGWQTAETHLRTLWEQEGPAGHAYDAFYWQVAERILREEWRAITSPEGAKASERMLLAQPLYARLRQCIVEVTADRMIADAATQLTVLVRLHTGRPLDEHTKDLTLPLYYLAHQQQHPDAPVEILLAYAGTTLAEETDEAEGTDGAAEASEPGSLKDVTEKARSAATKYLNPLRKTRSALDKLDEAALGILAQEFALHPNERRCAACAFCYVCPSDPESTNTTTATGAGAPA